MPSNLERKASRKKRQTRLTFELDPTAAASSSPGSKLTPAKVRYGTRGKDGVFAVRTPPRKISFAVESDATAANLDDDSDEQPTSTSSRRRMNRFDGGDGLSSPPRTQGGMFSSSRGVNASKSGNDSDDSESSDEPTIQLATRKRKPVTITIEDSSDELNKSNLVLKPARRMRRSKALSEPVPDADQSDSDPVVISSVVRKPARNKTVLGDSSEEDIVSPRKRARRNSVDSSSSSDSDIRASPAKRRHTSNGPSNSASNVDSTPSSPVHVTRKITQRKRHRTQKEKELELMKLRRAGDKNAVLPDSESSSEEESDAEQTLEHLSEFEDEEEDEEPEEPKVRPSKKGRGPSKIHEEDDDNEEEDEDDFIIEDDDGAIGIPGSSNIPLEFTSHYNKPIKEHFRDAVEFFVHKELNPTYTEKQDLFKRAFHKLDSKPEALMHSEYKSSQWTSQFIVALEARPNYVETPVSGTEFGEGRCEACNRSKHPPKFSISFTGKTYNKETLEEIEQDDGDDSDEQDSGGRAGSVDGLGRRIAPEDKEFLTGRFCRAKAQKAHLLSHWRYHLYDWVRGELENEPELAPERVLKHRKLKPWEKRDQVEAIIERWENNGKLKGLYRDYNESVSKLGEIDGGSSGRWG
ncbi:hypothetical protein GLAREA_06214 [Glarea lozoyensis ATCC 20868]|uniref:DUF4211 domain-containing protein n=1 Tax=Glarea lozoyensis (strain ATCC 20868 / MF5171) TaxID=1116229 RepID=S3D405_GLAL2|nr:uncharacterized protein GLAREA_06214 [Glarea lozoyensis ATCC 20868]EPE33202.1 hypothetical protein GLAREA_06214 [Glarea lozoyensis ATCC 20868]